ncbi:MAG: FAD:protein FMN transferase [Methylophilales bacterium]|nr:FAD:protein FMN transferase [Methylophilales bacterium]
MRHRCLWLVWIAFFLVNCGREPLYQSQSYVFGTLVDISIYGESDARAAELAGHIQQEFQRLHNQLHAWQPSDLSKLNAVFAAGQSLPISQELAQMLIEATRISVASDGLFNPAIGGLIGLWGFQRDDFTAVSPSTNDIQALVNAKPSLSNIVIENGVATSKNKAVKLDLGGYAKGAALDLASSYLREQKVKGALINIGGNIIAVGQHGERLWHVGIQHPRKPQAIATLDLPDGWAIGTSGDYQRFFMRDGKRFCHIIDPRSGEPAQGVQAVTVLIPPSPNAGAWSDAASKPLFISGRAHWKEMATKLGVANAMLIDAQGHVELTPAMQQKLHFEK